MKNNNLELAHNLFNFAFASPVPHCVRNILIVLTSSSGHYQKALPRLYELFPAATIDIYAKDGACIHAKPSGTIKTFNGFLDKETIHPSFSDTINKYDLVILTICEANVQGAGRHYNLYDLFYDYDNVYVLNKNYSLASFDAFFANRMVHSVSGQFKIHANMTAEACQCLYDHAKALPEQATIVEIGRGGSTICLARGLCDGLGGTMISIDIGTSQMVKRQLKKHEVSNVTLWDMTSTEAFFMFTNHEKINQADLVFIDGAHDLITQSSDIILWKKVLKPGGTAIVHDYLFHGHPEVGYAVYNGMIKTGDFENYSFIDHTFIAFKKDSSCLDSSSMLTNYGEIR